MRFAPFQRGCTVTRAGPPLSPSQVPVLYVVPLKLNNTPCAQNVPSTKAVPTLLALHVWSLITFIVVDTS